MNVCRTSGFIGAGLLLALAALAGTAEAQRRMNDDEARRIIIDESIRRWNGECPCPYSYAWNGKQCAENSAYMKRTPYAPYCYPQDVPSSVVYRYRMERGN
jgi:hypothetical protein